MSDDTAYSTQILFSKTALTNEVTYSLGRFLKTANVVTNVVSLIILLFRVTIPFQVYLLKSRLRLNRTKKGCCNHWTDQAWFINVIYNMFLLSSSDLLYYDFASSVEYCICKIAMITIVQTQQYTPDFLALHNVWLIALS